MILQVVGAGPIHGYALAHRIRLISRDILQIQQGSLYPALHRLEHRGFLTAERKASESGRDVKFYRLTTKGRAQLKTETTNWARLSEAIALILRPRQGAVSWWQRLRNRDQLERELDAELRYHFDRQVVENRDRLLSISGRDSAGRRLGVSYLDFLDWRAATKTFSGLAAFIGGNRYRPHCRRRSGLLFPCTPCDAPRSSQSAQA